MLKALLRIPGLLLCFIGIHLRPVYVRNRLILCNRCAKFLNEQAEKGRR